MQKFVLKTVGLLLAVLVVAVGALSLFLSLRPSGKTVESTIVINVEASFKSGRSFTSYLPLIDYMDVNGPILYTGNTIPGFVGVVDTVQSRAVAIVTGVGAVHGVAIDADDGLGFASDSTTNTVDVFDPKSNQVLAKIPVDDGPDAIVYDRKFRLIYVANGSGTGDLIDPVSLKVKDRIVLGGKAEYPQVDPDTGVIYQNVMDTGEVVIVDPLKAAVTARFKMGASQKPTGLALDNIHHRLFATGLNRQAVILNAQTGAVITTLPVGYGSDGIAYDPGMARIYVANGVSATMTVIQQDTPDRYHVLEDAPTHFGGHTVVVDPATHRIYLAYFGRVAVYTVVR